MKPFQSGPIRGPVEAKRAIAASMHQGKLMNWKNSGQHILVVDNNQFFFWKSIEILI
jgi:hypothetical protein